MSQDAESEFADWISLNAEGRRLLLQREEALHAVPGRLDWEWKATPFNRISLMNLLARHLVNCRYLEIGCDKDELFHALPIEDKTGVDPVRGGNCRMTSDAFFNQNKRQFDLIFIDGLHSYGQIRRDIEHAFQALAPGGWIGLHDMLPRDWKEQHIPRVQGLWTGDVWKAAFELARTPGLDFRIVKIDHGVGLVRKIEVETPQLADLREDLEPQGFAYFFEHHASLPLIEWGDACNWIARLHDTPQ